MEYKMLRDWSLTLVSHPWQRHLLGWSWWWKFLDHQECVDYPFLQQCWTQGQSFPIDDMHELENDKRRKEGDTWLSILFRHFLGMNSFTLLNIGICGAHFEIPKIFSASAYFLPPYFITSYTAVLFQCQKAETGCSVWQSHLKRQALKQTAEKRLHFIIFYN